LSPERLDQTVVKGPSEAAFLSRRQAPRAVDWVSVGGVAL
jgi:hypothetical protein